MCYLFIVRQVISLFVYIGKKSPVYGVLDSNFHTRLAIVTENELGLAFPPRNLPKKFRPDPSTFYLVIVVTDRQTDRQTNAGDYIIPHESFHVDKKHCLSVHCVLKRDDIHILNNSVKNELILMIFGT